jgi:hypothetical protein
VDYSDGKEIEDEAKSILPGDSSKVMLYNFKSEKPGMLIPNSKNCLLKLIDI